MKIAIICEVLGEPNNGTTIAALNLIGYLKSKGHDVRVVCPDEDRRGQEGYYILPKSKIINMLCTRNSVKLARFDRDIIYEAVKDADIVHFMIPLYIARRASKFIAGLGKPVTAGFHAQAQNFSSHFGLIHCGLFNHLTYGFYDKNLFCRTQAIHYPTKFIRDVFESEVKRKTNGYVISNGVNSEFKPMKAEKLEEFKDKFCILFTGRLAVEKSHMVLLKAVSRSRYKDKIQLIFAGKGPMEKKLKAYSSKHLSNQPLIRFFSREELLEVINWSDLYCHPAEAEIEAIACLEAIACGLVPLIANSPDCATREFSIDAHCLFKVNDSADLAKKIDWFIDHPAERAALRERYIRESTLYDHAKCMEQMEKMFETEISRAKENGKN